MRGSSAQMAKERDVAMGLEVSGGDDVEWFGLQANSVSMVMMPKIPSDHTS